MFVLLAFAYSKKLEKLLPKHAKHNCLLQLVQMNEGMTRGVGGCFLTLQELPPCVTHACFCLQSCKAHLTL